MTLDVKMAWRNIWRNPRRSILTMSAVAFATLLLTFMLSWQFGSYATMINSAVRIHTGHLQVQAQEYYENRHIREVVPDPQSVGLVLEETPGVAAYAFRANAFSLVSSRARAYGALVVGIDPEREAAVSTLPELIRQGDYLSARDREKALIGKLLAQNLKTEPGDELVLLGQARDGSIAATAVTVKGVFSSGQDELDRSTIHIPLDFFQALYAMRGAVHEVVVLGESPEGVPEIKQRIAENLQDGLVALDWKQLMPGLVQAIKMDLISGLIFYAILIVVVSFSILNTFLMAIFERTREFGVMLAVGATPGRLARLLLIESSGLTLLGVVVGIALGSMVTWYFQVHGIFIPGAGEILRQYGLSERMFPRLSALSISVGAGLVLAITLLTAVYPAFRVRRLRPVSAMSAA